MKIKKTAKNEAVCYAHENKALGLFENPSVAAHPEDLGMERIAQRIIGKL